MGASRTQRPHGKEGVHYPPASPLPVLALLAGNGRCRLAGSFLSCCSLGEVFFRVLLTAPGADSAGAGHRALLSAGAGLGLLICRPERAPSGTGAPLQAFFLAPGPQAQAVEGEHGEDMPGLRPGLCLHGAVFAGKSGRPARVCGHGTIIRTCTFTRLTMGFMAQHGVSGILLAHNDPQDNPNVGLSLGLTVNILLYKFSISNVKVNLVFS